MPQIINMSAFWIPGVWIYQGYEYASGSEYVKCGYTMVLKHANVTQCS